MTVEIPIVCQGSKLSVGADFLKLADKTVSVRIEMVGLCGNLDKKNICLITGENCILKSRRTIFTGGLGDGDEEFID